MRQRFEVIIEGPDVDDFTWSVHDIEAPIRARYGLLFVEDSSTLTVRACGDELAAKDTPESKSWFDNDGNPMSPEPEKPLLVRLAEEMEFHNQRRKELRDQMLNQMNNQ